MSIGRFGPYFSAQNERKGKHVVRARFKVKSAQQRYVLIDIGYGISPIENRHFYLIR